MTHVTCRLTTKNRDQLRDPTFGNRVLATFTFLLLIIYVISEKKTICNPLAHPTWKCTTLTCEVPNFFYLTEGLHCTCIFRTCVFQYLRFQRPQCYRQTTDVTHAVDIIRSPSLSIFQVPVLSDQSVASVLSSSINWLLIRSRRTRCITQQAHQSHFFSHVHLNLFNHDWL